MARNLMDDAAKQKRPAARHNK
jgi:hypothetical protein